MQIFYTGLHLLVFQYLKLTSSRYRTSPEWGGSVPSVPLALNYYYHYSF